MDRFKPLFSALITLAAGGLVGGLAALAATNHLHPKQSEEVNETKTVVRQPEADDSCLQDKTGIVKSIHTEKVNLGDKENPSSWTWGTTVTFEIEAGKNLITCNFEGAYDLSKVWKEEMMLKPTGGRRL